MSLTTGEPNSKDECATSRTTEAYNLDPTGRTRETVATGKTSADVIDHYAGGGDAPAWAVEIPSGNWTRNIQGLGGGLAAIQVNGATPVLQLTDLHGDIIATASASETETKLLSSTETSEYGVPTTSSPAKYSWLGAKQQPTELASGVVAMGSRSYVPQLGRYLQTDPVPGGSANAYAYTFGDPVDESDPSGADGMPAWLLEADINEAHELTEAATARRIEEEERKAAEEAAARAAAQAAAASAAAAAAAADAPSAEPKWMEEYAMGGPSLDEINASKGIIPGGGMVEEGGGGGGAGGGDGLHVITYKGGPGATCGSNSTKHRKCPNHWKGGGGGETFGEVIEETIGIVQCIYEDGDCPEFGQPPGAK